jgi:hypothetical protein
MKLFNVYADVSCSPESFVMRAPLDVIQACFGMHDSAIQVILAETKDGGPSQRFDNGRGRYPLGLKSVVIVEVR